MHRRHLHPMRRVHLDQYNPAFQPTFVSLPVLKRYCIYSNNNNKNAEYDDDHRDEKNNSNYPESIQKISRSKMIRKKVFFWDNE